jgi:hypothetical protein
MKAVQNKFLRVRKGKFNEALCYLVGRRELFAQSDCLWVNCAGKIRIIKTFETQKQAECALRKAVKKFTPDQWWKLGESDV